MEVLYIGDEKLQSHQFSSGAEVFQVFHQRMEDYGPVLETLEELPDVSVEHMGGRATIEEFPDSVDELAEYDALIVSDLSRGTLQPHFHPDAIPGPNRVRVIKDFVNQGGGLVFCGGWMTFQGYHGVGNWSGSLVEETLPVEIQPVFDDRVERPEGATISDVETDHPVTSGLDWEEFPPVYGYNRTRQVKDRATSLASVEGDPLLAVNEYGDGRVVAYTSDPGIMWGLGFIEWEDYPEFWDQALTWATDGGE